MSKWCIDPNAEVVPDTTYDENEAAADPIGPEVTESSRPDALYGAPGGGDQPEYQDYEEEDLSIPPPPVQDEPFEQTESTYEEPVYDDFDDSAASALDTGYGSPAPSAPRGGPRRNGGGAGPRRGGNRANGNRRKNGKQGRPSEASLIFFLLFWFNFRSEWRSQKAETQWRCPTWSPGLTQHFIRSARSRC